MQILPLSTEPFTAPVDRDMQPSERRAFVRTHRTCVFGTSRRADGPAMSVVYYVPTDGDELLVSTMGERSKAKVVARDGKASLCVLDESWPFTYLQVYCDATVDDDPDLVIDVMMAVAGRMSGTPLPEDARPVVQAMAEQEQRVVLRCRPYATFAQPPRHLHSNDQPDQLTHWVSAAMPWDAEDTEVEDTEVEDTEVEDTEVEQDRS
jgi:PPOX class probable F420-dependent enzyme